MATKKKAANAVKATVSKESTLTISAPRLTIATFEIEGTAPYVQNKFSQKARREIMDTQEKGAQAKSKKKRVPKDFKDIFEKAQHKMENGSYGIPAPAFRSAMIDACRLVGYKMVFAKLSVFIEADGFDVDDGTPLVKLIAGKPEWNEMPVRLRSGGTIDIRVRPMWRKWKAKVRVKFDEDQFSAQDVANLMMRAGAQVGIGEGRPNSKESHGMGWGTFKIKE